MRTLDRVVRSRGETITLATGRAFATSIGFPPGFNAVDIEVTSSTIEAILVSFAPRIAHLYFYDDSLGTWTDFTTEATDRNTASLVNLSAMQTADRLYVAGTKIHDGLRINVVGTNGSGTANAVWEYPTAGSWTNLSATDGTDSTATLDQDGVVTWTPPATTLWVAARLQDIAVPAPVSTPKTERYYWTRMRVSANITDTSVTQGQYSLLFTDTLNTLLNDNSGEDDFRITSNNGTMPPYRFSLDRRNGAIELISTSITSAANINWLVLR